MQCGNNHNLLYSRLNGKLLSYGSNERGQLGLGHFNQVKGIVNLSYLLGNKKVTHLEVKCDTNAICFNDGSSLVWPMALGDRLSPDPFSFRLPKQKIVNIGVGFDFVIYLTSVGKLYSMGKTNNYGELGLGDFKPRHNPTLLSNLCQSGDM